MWSSKAPLSSFCRLLTSMHTRVLGALLTFENSHTHEV